MKRRVYILMFMALLLFTGCNLFKGLDKEKLSSPEAFNFKLDDAMASGDYTVVVGMIDSKIADSPTLKAVDDTIGDKFTSISSITSSTSIAEMETIYKTLTTYLDENISKPEVKEYIELKVTQAEAYLGQSGLKLTDIISKMTTSNNSSNKINSLKSVKAIQKSTSGDSKISISDLVPSGLDVLKLQAAVNSYLKSLPTTTGVAFDFVKNDYQLAYLNAALSSAISAINRFIDVYKDTSKSETVLVSSGVAFSGDYPTKWASEVGRIRIELKAALYYINRYVDCGNSLISTADRDKLNSDFNKLDESLESFDQTKYVDFTSSAGLTINN